MTAAATRLAESQFSEIRAITDYQIAQVDLAFATGTLLGAAKVDWAPIAAPDPKILYPSPEEKINDPAAPVPAMNDSSPTPATPAATVTDELRPR